MNPNIRLTYVNKDGNIECLYRVFSASEKIEEKCVTVQLLQESTRLGTHYKVHIEPKEEITIVEAQLSFVYSFVEQERIFVNGYQTWTISKEYSIKDKQRGTRFVPKIIKKIYAVENYGDYSFYHYPYKKGQLHGYTYAYIKNQQELTFIGSINDKNAFTRIEMNTNKNAIKVVSDCTNYHCNNAFTVLDFFLLKGTEKEVFSCYFEALGPSRNAKELNGYCSWYNHYQNINEEIILDNLERISSFPNDLFQIDDGYQCFVGDWLDIDERKFPHGMKYIANKIHEKNMLAGIWLAPFVAETKSKVFQLHPEWLAKGKNGKPIKCGANWSKFYLLDLQNEEVILYLKACFKTVLDDWGFDFVKLDFLYAAALQPSTTMTRGQLQAKACQFLRDCVKDKLILGCGVPLASCFNVFDYCRIGCDVSLNYEGKKIETWVNQETISTKRSMLNTIYRRQLNHQVFVNDPDVYLLRNQNTSLVYEQKRALTIINMLFGGLYLTSDNVGLYNVEQKKIYMELRKYEKAEVMDVITRTKEFIDIVLKVEGKEEKITLDLRTGIII